MAQYRTGIGAVIWHAPTQKIYIFERADGYGWQWPEGGIDDGEDVLLALERELFEEVGLKEFVVKAQTTNFLYYDFPENFIHMRARGFVGQRKKIFLVEPTAKLIFDFNTHTTPEFVSSQLVSPADCVAQAVSFKQAMYQAALAEFGLL